MFFEDEPEWMRKARTIPLRSTWESRQRDNAAVESKPNENEAQKRTMK